MKKTWVQDCMDASVARRIIDKTDMSDKPVGSYYEIYEPKDESMGCSLYFCDPNGGKMSNPEEPAYQQFEGECRECGRDYHYYNSVKRHHDICDDCEKAKIVRTLTGQKTFGGVVKGQG